MYVMSTHTPMTKMIAAKTIAVIFRPLPFFFVLVFMLHLVDKIYFYSRFG